MAKNTQLIRIRQEDKQLLDRLMLDYINQEYNQKKTVKVLVTYPEFIARLIQTYIEHSSVCRKQR